MLPEPLYRPADLRPAYQLRYGWTGWPSKAPFPTGLLARVLPDIAPEWEIDGLRVLESSLAPRQIQLTLSTTPQVPPVTLASRVKGRMQHHCRRRGTPIDFSRKLAVRSLGDPTRVHPRWKPTSATRYRRRPSRTSDSGRCWPRLPWST